MKKILLFLFIASSFSASANQGGPDAFGYIWKDSNEPGGPAYQWFEISTIGTQISGLGDDNFVGPFQLGFPFAFYWSTESKIWVGSNGYIEFDPGNLAANFPVIPTAGGVNNYIGGITSDMTFLGANNPGRIYLWSNQDSMVVEYKDVPFFSPNLPGYDVNSSNTFEIVLNRLDSSITVNFQSFTGFSISNITSGIENSVGNMGLQPLASQPPQQAYTIRYYYPLTALQITDASADWNDNDGNAGIFLAQNGSPLTLRAQVSNSGNQNIGPVSVYEQVKTLTNTAVVSNSDISGSLVPNQNQLITFSNQFMPVTAGTFRNVTTINGVSGDMIAVNDSVVHELVVVDTTVASIRLCYTVNHTNPANFSISWNGGSGGVGMYFKPPTYPARIVSTNYVVAYGPATGTAFYAKVYDDNGPGGSPGTLLDSVPVLVSMLTIPGVTTVPVSGNIVIASGGFYVNWEMATTNVAISEDRTPPFSRRSYETFQNIWSTYRDYQNADFFIGADYVTAQPEDVGVSSIVTPANNSTVTNNGPVSCYIKNFGNSPDNFYIQVNFKLANNANIVSQMYAGSPIQPGDSVLFNFTTPLVVPYSATDILYVWTSKTSDVDNSNDTSSVTLVLVGMEETSLLQGLTVYPNPAKDRLIFAFASGTGEPAEIIITDVSGRFVHAQKTAVLQAGDKIEVDLSGISAGAYFYSVQTGNKRGNGKITRLN